MRIHSDHVPVDNLTAPWHRHGVYIYCWIKGVLSQKVQQERNPRSPKLTCCKNLWNKKTKRIKLRTLLDFVFSEPAVLKGLKILVVMWSPR